MLDYGVSPWEVKDELNANAARREVLQQQLALQSDPKPLLHPDMGKLYREWVVESRAALAHEDTSNEAAAALRKIIDRITLTPENGKLGIVVQGELARLLSVASPLIRPRNFSSA